MNRCPQLYAPSHGSIALCSNLPGQTCQFSCDRGYFLTGSTTRTCNSNRAWSGEKTHCNGEDHQISKYECWLRLERAIITSTRWVNRFSWMFGIWLGLMFQEIVYYFKSQNCLTKGTKTTTDRHRLYCLVLKIVRPPKYSVELCRN